MLDRALKFISNTINDKRLSKAAGFLDEAVALSDVKSLIEQKININTQDGGLALNYAASRCHDEIIHYLLEKGLKRVNEENNEGFTPLISALNVKSRQKRHYDHEKKDWGAEIDETKTVKILLEHKANVDAEDIKGNKPLMYAVCNPDAVKLLLEKKASVNQANNEGDTPLFAAVENNNLEVVRLLLENKADVNHKSKEGGTVLQKHWELRQKKFLPVESYRIVEILLEYKLDVNYQVGYRGRTLLMELIHECGAYWNKMAAYSLVDTLLQSHTINLELRDRHDRLTALEHINTVFFCEESMKMNLTQLLISKGASIQSLERVKINEINTDTEKNYAQMIKHYQNISKKNVFAETKDNVDTAYLETKRPEKISPYYHKMRNLEKIFASDDRLSLFAQKKEKELAYLVTDYLNLNEGQDLEPGKEQEQKRITLG